MICLTNCPLAAAANNWRFTDNENSHIFEITVLDLSMKVKRVSLLIVFANLAPVQLHSSTQTEFVFIQVLRTKSNFFSQQPLMSTLEPAMSYCEDPHCFDILFLHQCNALQCRHICCCIHPGQPTLYSMPNKIRVGISFLLSAAINVRALDLAAT